jgi:hypothetical protein
MNDAGLKGACMRYLESFGFTIALLASAMVAEAPAQKISDPYEILGRYFEASGGLDRMRAEQTTHSVGAITMGGMEGTAETWTQKPGKNRIEIALGPLNIIQGDNGEHSWVLDQNGKLQVITNPDEATVKRRQVRILIEDYAYADRQSENFIAALSGIEEVDGKECYVIRITNNINIDSYTCYINTNDLMLEKAAFVEDIESRDVFYGDYREIEGLLIPFETRQVSHQTGQVLETKLTTYESNPEIDPSLFEPPEQGARDYRFTSGDKAENIPFEFIENHVFIPVTVSGKERLWVLDTGAAISVLNKAFAEELGLDLEGELKGAGAGGTVEASFTTVPPYSIKGIEFQSQIVAVIDMDELIRRLGLDIVGVLGFDFLSRFVTRVDFANEMLSFYDPEIFEYDGDGCKLDVHIDNSVFGVKAILDGSRSGTWLFDLGASVTSLDGRYALRERLTERDGVLRMAHGAGNEFQTKKIRCDSLQFAGFTVYHPEISFSYGGTDTTFTADNIGVLGNSLFRNFVIYCDYTNERLIVEKGAKFNQPWPTDNSGLQIAWNRSRNIDVSYVSPDSPAEKAGFRKGDIIRSINDINIDLFDGVIAVRKLLRSDPGTKYEFMVDREGKTRKLKLKLAELL